MNKQDKAAAVEAALSGQAPLNTNRYQTRILQTSAQTFEVQFRKKSLFFWLSDWSTKTPTNVPSLEYARGMRQEVAEQLWWQGHKQVIE